MLGIVRYSAAPRPRLLFSGVPFTDTVRVGERVLTSVLSRRFPRGVPVGTVRRVGRDPSGLMQEIEVAPAAALTRLRHVFVTPGPPPIATVSPGGAP